MYSFVVTVFHLREYNRPAQRGLSPLILVPTGHTHTHTHTHTHKDPVRNLRRCYCMAICNTLVAGQNPGTVGFSQQKTVLRSSTNSTFTDCTLISAAFVSAFLKVG
jgi:hypothetical protein